MRRRRRLFLVLASLSMPMVMLPLFSAGCGPSVSAIEEDDLLDGGKDARTDGRFDGSKPTDAGKDGFDEYVDPGCPDTGPPIEDYRCDPYDQGNGDCFDGEGCYIYVSYPDEPCGKETYGAVCLPVGPGGQGDACNGGQDCGAGFVCVVTGSGTQCVEFCPLTGNDGCPPGLVCEPIDVEGFGGCL